MPHINMTGHAETFSEQEINIFINCKYYPNSISWNEAFEGFNIKKEEFFDNLFLSTEKNGGNSFFYPVPTENVTICRFEWHYPYKGKAAQIRLGAVFRVPLRGVPAEVNYYIYTNAGFESKSAENVPSKFTGAEIKNYKKFLKREISNANSSHSRLESWNFIFYAHTPINGFHSSLNLVKNIRLLPSRIVEGKNLTAIIFTEQGKTRRDAQRKAGKKFDVCLAIMTLISGSNFSGHKSDQFLPTIMKGNPNTPEKLLLESIFSGKVSSVPSTGYRLKTSTEAVLKESLRIIFSNDNEVLTTLSACFSFYSAVMCSGISQSLAIVGYIAALSTLSVKQQEKCEGDVCCSKCGALTNLKHNLVGDREAIEKMVIEVLYRRFNKLSDKIFVKKWMQNVYNKQRSAFVHQATHRFSDHSIAKSMADFFVAEMPSAIPNDEDYVRSGNLEYTNALKVRDVLRIVLIDSLFSNSDFRVDFSSLGLDCPDFADLYNQEFYYGFPTRGWVRIHGGEDVE